MQILNNRKMFAYILPFLFLSYFASLKKQYLSQYNDLSGFKKIPVMYGPNGLEQI